MREFLIALAGLIAGLGLFTALRPIPDFAFVLQGASLGAVIGAVITYRRQLTGEHAGHVVARWTLAGASLSCLAVVVDLMLAKVIS